MPRFDNFKYYFEHKAEYNDEYYLAQMFYWHYVRPFGYDCIDGHINALTRLVRQDFKRMLSMSVAFEKDCREMFSEMCAELKIRKDVSQIKQLVPFDWFGIKEYIGPAYADYFGVGNFISGMALLMAFEQYTDVVFDNEEMERQLYLIKRCSQVDANVIGTIRKSAYDYCRILFGDGIDEGHALPDSPAQGSPASNGSFVLPWKCVEFMNGKVFLYHSAEYGRRSTHPLVVVNKKSKIAMNYIKRYLSGKCPPLSVRSKNGVLTKLYNSDDLLRCVDILDERLNTPVAARKPKVRKPFHKRMETGEIKRKLHEYKSVYLDFLCDKQLAAYNIIYCPENRVNNEVQADEDSFIFTIGHAYGKTRIVFENTLDKRSSIVVTCYERQYEYAVKKLSGYFASEIVNKRENVGKLQAKLKQRDIVMRKVMHTNFEEWKMCVLR